jgi:muconolactone delta-isomerase
MFATTLDDQIRSVDRPERLQCSVDPKSQSRVGERKQVSNVELAEEAQWIFAQKLWRVPGTQPSSDSLDIQDKIEQVLRFFHLPEYQYDVPFICTYRSDYISPLKSDELWRILEADDQWATLKRKKDGLLALGPILAEASVSSGQRFVRRDAFFFEWFFFLFFFFCCCFFLFLFSPFILSLNVLLD